MPTRIDRRRHPAAKHGAYSATAVLPGENRAEFEKLHRDLIAEYNISGAHEHEIILSMAGYIWRKRNLSTFRIAEGARQRRQAIVNGKLPRPLPDLNFVPMFEFKEHDPATREEYEKARTASWLLGEAEAKKELGKLYELTNVGEAATFDGLAKELDIEERLDAAINKCLKQLLLVRGVKSVAVALPSVDPKLITALPKAAYSSTTNSSLALSS